MIGILAICFIFCFYESVEIGNDAKSVMHQIYAAEYSIMATLFFCSSAIVSAINSNKSNKETKNDKEEKK